MTNQARTTEARKTSATFATHPFEFRAWCFFRHSDFVLPLDVRHFVIRPLSVAETPLGFLSIGQHFLEGGSQVVGPLGGPPFKKLRARALESRLPRRRKLAQALGLLHFACPLQPLVQEFAGGPAIVDLAELVLKGLDDGINLVAKRRGKRRP